MEHHVLLLILGQNRTVDQIVLVRFHGLSMTAAFFKLAPCDARHALLIERVETELRVCGLVGSSEAAIRVTSERAAGAHNYPKQERQPRKSHSSMPRQMRETIEIDHVGLPWKHFFHQHPVHLGVHIGAAIR